MKFTLSLAFLFFIGISFAQNNEEFTPEELIAIENYQHIVDSINNTFTYSFNEIDIKNGLATLQVPGGYKFLDAEQSKRVLTDIWGNPPSDDTLGLLFKVEGNPVGDDMSYAVEITYSDEGHIEDDDAKDIDYDDLLEEMQNDSDEINEERIKLGYEAIEFVGWASPPFYDEDSKKLHWARELKFGESELNTLNYNIRVLGREGYLNLNVIGDMDVLPDVKHDVNQIISSVSFNEGNTYADFDSSIDKVAAYGIGGLIAGKVLAKAGAFAFLLKFWKIIALAAAGFFTAFKKKIFGGGKKEDVA